MKAKYIYEKFKEESDPIKDMGIGIIDLSEDFKEMYQEPVKAATEKWSEHLKSILEGHTIRGEFDEWMLSPGGGYWYQTKISIYVEEIIEHFSESGTLHVKGREVQMGTKGRLRRYKLDVNKTFKYVK